MNESRTDILTLYSSSTMICIVATTCSAISRQMQQASVSVALARLMAVPCSHPVHHSTSTSTTSVWPSVTTMQDLRLVREAVHNSC